MSRVSGKASAQPFWNSSARPAPAASSLKLMVQVVSRSELESSQAPTIGVPVSPWAWAREATPALAIDATRNAAVNCGRVIAAPGVGDQRSVVRSGENMNANAGRLPTDY